MELKIEVYINDTINKLATDRLINFTIQDNMGLLLDNLEITMSNVDNFIVIPSTNSTIEIAIGYDHLYKMGKFIIQNIDANSSQIVLKGISQDLSKGKIKYNRVFNDKSLDDVLKTIANDLDLSLQMDSSFKDEKIEYYLQENKTSLEILAELSEIFYAIANIKDNNLVFIPKENSKPLEIKEADILSITKEDMNNKFYDGVIYNYWNIKEAKLETTKLGNDPYLILQNTLPEGLKNTYINSKYKEIQQKQYINLILQGNPICQAGFSFILNTTDQYSQFNGKYIIHNVNHKYNNTYVTSVLAVKID